MEAWEQQYKAILEEMEKHPVLHDLENDELQPMIWYKKWLLELNAQLDRLTALGLPVSYVDAHMAPDAAIPGLSDEMRSWAAGKGLLYVRDYYNFPPADMPAFGPTEEVYQKNVERWLDS